MNNMFLIIFLMLVSCFRNNKGNKIAKYVLTLKLGADINIKDSYGCTQLMQACWRFSHWNKNRKEVIKSLIQGGCGY